MDKSRQTIQIAKMQRRFLWLVAVGDQTCEHIYKEIDRTTVSSVLNLGYVLELVNHRLNDGSLA